MSDRELFLIRQVALAALEDHRGCAPEMCGGSRSDPCPLGDAIEALMAHRSMTLQGQAIEPFAAAAPDCSGEHGVGHSDCPRCWHRSERNPNRGVEYWPPKDAVCVCDPAIRMYCAAGDCQGGSLVPSWQPATWADVRRGDVVRMPGNEATAARVVELVDLPWHVNDIPPGGLTADQRERYLKNVQFRPQEHAAEWTARPVTLAPLDGGPQHRIPNVNPAAAVEIRLTRVEMDAIELLGGWASRVSNA